MSSDNFKGWEHVDGSKVSREETESAFSKIGTAALGVGKAIVGGGVMDPIFVRADVDDVTNALTAKNYSAEALHGEISQAQRTRVIEAFNRLDAYVFNA